MKTKLLPRAWFALLMALVLMLATGLPGRSLAQATGATGATEPPDEPLEAPGASGTARLPVPNAPERFAGEPFFLLTDASFGSSEAARVRLELNAPEQLANSGGVDIVLYRVPEPLAFLQKQRNLHRIQVEGKPAGESLANTLTHLWDSWVAKARLAWQRLFSREARQAVTTQAPELKTSPRLRQPSRFEEPPQFKPLPGLPVVQRFRYPIHMARAIQPPKDLKLQGSSSEFIRPAAGNVFVPLGVQKPGLYLVEAVAGQHRATTLLFVSDTLALTKVSGTQMLVWSTQRQQGTAVAGTQVVWSDGLGVLKTGKTNTQGLLTMERPSAPEMTYVFGQDPAGGVFISENFYYDSEIYNAKVYAVTDRPLYRPGDRVQLKVSGREFKNARDSVALADGDLALEVRDPTGQVIATQTLKFSGNSGADGAFWLPDNATAGGYELMMSLRGERYAAAFRVADYQKPHFDIQWLPDKPDFASGEAVSGAVQLNYPDGKPVANARLSLSARAQALSMVEGELDDSGAFPLKLAQDELQTDSNGQARFKLPPADQPSRYVLSLLATDGAAYRVRSTRELLIERGSAGWLLTPQRQFSQPGESLSFSWRPGRRATEAAPQPPVSWEWLRLEDRQRASGSLPTVPAGGGSVALSFPQPGSYTVTLRDAQKRVVAATPHFVAGAGLRIPAGSIGIVFDKPRYAPGDTAEALLTFPEPVAQALLTLERERVETAVLLSDGGEGFQTERLNPTQWRVRLPVSQAMSPNITFSVAYTRNAESVFQNQGLSVVQPRIALAFKTDKPVYAPGDTVTVEVNTTLGGQPVVAEVAVGVVDEMIYVLQPELAPSIEDFFYHPRRNNVRTSVSQSFIGYDLATSRLGELPNRRSHPERAIKVLERPRRDNVDTAAWEPRLRTDASGRARFSFRMPDSLTRWRLTGRAMDAKGLVGQQTAWVRSDKAFFAKWTSPDWQRLGDKAQASLALFNQGRETQEVEWQASATGFKQQGKLKLKPGANFVTLPLTADTLGALDLTITLHHQGKQVDSLSTTLQRLPVAWSQPRELVLDLSNGPAALNLPADARNVRVTLASDPAAGTFSRWVDQLVDYPYGCVEQTASRMLPLSLALQSLSAAQQPLAPMLTQRLSAARLSLAQMAGPQAVFGWWGRGMAEDPFLTAYAYYADWRATQALRSPLAASHWERLLTVYAEAGVKTPVVQRALALHWMQEMGLPVASMQDALLDELMQALATDGLPKHASSSLVIRDGQAGGRDFALVLAAYGASARISPAQHSEAEAAAGRLSAHPSPLVQSLLILARKGGAAQANALLAQVRGEQASFDRAQSLMWLHKALGGTPELRTAAAGSLGTPWVAAQGSVGQPVFTLAPQAARPAQLAASGAKAAFVAFESSETSPAPALPVQIERRLYKVVTQATGGKSASTASAARGEHPAGQETGDASGSGGASTGLMPVRLEPVAPGTALDTNALYLDVLTLRSTQTMRWGLLEVALPPGAAVEAGTWGLMLDGGPEGKRVPLERAVHQNIRLGYAVPVEQLNAGQSVTLRHLLRFSQRGQFQLPPARFHRMYEPEAKALEQTPHGSRLEVR